MSVPAPSTEEAPAAAMVKKKTGTIVINLGRCRYEVIRQVAEGLNFRVDFDVENLASTLNKTIGQPVQRNSSGNQQQQQPQQQQPTTPKTGAANSVAASIPAMRSNLSMIAAGSNISRAPLMHDAVFAMIESRRAHIMWSDVTVTHQQLGQLACWQRLNHFPGISATLSRKVPLAQTMMRAWRAAPEYFSDLVPLSFSLKRDAAILRQYFEEVEFSTKLKKKQRQQQKLEQQQQQQEQQQVEQQEQSTDTSGNNRRLVRRNSSSASTSFVNPFLPLGPIDTENNNNNNNGENAAAGPPKVFIFKPNAGCMGHDIKLTCKPLQMMNKLLSGGVTSKFIKEGEDYVCQAYIDRPLLIERRKFDLRVYVLLLSVSPELRVLVHREGLVRLCASEYVPPRPSNVRKSTVHLTNYAVNKRKLGRHCDAARSQNQAGSDAAAAAAGDEEDEEGMGDDEEIFPQQQQQQQQQKSDDGDGDDQSQDAKLSIGGIKRDFTYLNGFLDSSFPSIGGSGEIWRRIDRVIVLTLMAAHEELDQTYRRAATANQVLLRRSALQHLKELRQQKEEKDAEQESQQQRQQQQQQAVAGEDDDDAADEESDEEEQHQQQPSSSGAKSETHVNKVDPLENPEEFVQNCCIGRNCFELLGYDLLLTEDGKPIVMEINHGPSLETGANIDMRVKSQVLSDLFRHVSVFLPDAKKKHTRTRRYLQRVIKKQPDSDLVLSPPTGFRLVHPLFETDSVHNAAQAQEYRMAQQALASKLNSTSTSATTASVAAAASAASAAAAAAAGSQQQQPAQGRTPLRPQNSFRNAPQQQQPQQLPPLNDKRPSVSGKKAVTMPASGGRWK